MNILNLLIRKKHFAGIEISDLTIRIAYFRPKKKYTLKQNLNELVLIEEPIPANIISNGVIINKELLGKNLKRIWNKEKLGESYAVVSIPEDKIYSRIFPFPKTIRQSRIKEAIDLAIDFQLPFKREDVYIGWENTSNSQIINKILVSAIPKNVADGYIKTLDNAGIDVFALESHLSSIARSIKLKLGEPTLLTKKNQDSATVFIIKDSILQFSRTLPGTFIKEEKSLTDEVSKIKKSFEYEIKETINELPFAMATIKDEYLKYLLPTSNTESQSKWLISVGAVIRGEISQGEDNQISLLPVSTAEAYKYQKIKTFITLIRNISIGVSIFFLITFCAAYLFIFSISQTINNRISTISITPISPEINNRQTLIKEVNSLTLVSQSILSTTPNWSILIDEINSRIIDGIIVSSFGAPSVSDTMSLIGIAINRDILNQFKKSLQGSDYLTSVDLPIKNLEQKGDIPFSITFHLKDPSMLYYK